MEGMRITIKEDVHQKSTEQAGKGKGTAMKIATDKGIVNRAR
jgi:hypothetical protein